MRAIGWASVVVGVVMGCAAPSGGEVEGGGKSNAPVDEAHPKAGVSRKVTHRMKGAPPPKVSSAADGRGAEGTYGIPIEYNGGYVMNAGVNIYLIWYGNWNGWKATTIIPEFIKGLSGSPYYNINTTYSDSHGRRVGNEINLVKEVTDDYSQGTYLSDVSAVVSDAVTSGKLPADVHGLYFVLGSDDVSEGGFCNGYCGYHSSTLVNDTYLKYSFVGNPAQCPYGCEPQQGTSPNGSPSADGMASIIAHELEETTSDPYADAWFDANGEENGDKCAWTFGAEYTTGNGTRANMQLGGRDFLIQQNWVNDGSGYCALKY